MSEQNTIEMDQFSTILTFLGGVDWKDPWLIGLFTFHITITMMALLTRNYGNLQALLFFFLSNSTLIVMVYSYLLSFSIPILLNCMLMVVGSWLWQSTQLMKNIKIAQLRENMRKQRAIEKEKKE